MEICKKILCFLVVTFVFINTCSLQADANKAGMGEPEENQAKHEDIRQSKKVLLQYGPLNYEKRTDPAMEKWRDNRFGQFIHWGLYAIPGGIWEGKTYNYAAEFLKASAKVSKEEWADLRHQFSIEKFNAEEWAAMAKDLGVKYVCLTTKHHEGFCMWPSKYTDFDIESTPYKKDLLKEFTDAYTAAGIDVYFYYSVLDWYNPDWRYNIKTEKDEEAFDRFKEFTKNQLVELVERYPSVKGLWFDGTWDKCWKMNGKFSYELEKLLKEKRPGLIVNSRMRADDFGKRHFDSNGDLMGDYESGYERRLPDIRDNDLVAKVVKRDWECCMTVPENQWGYHKDWSVSHVKTSNELIEMLVYSVSLNGNFLLNFGPKGDGSFRDEEVKFAREIGQWMKVNSPAIYGCGYAGLKKMDWGYYTRNMDTGKLFMVVCNVPVSGWLKVQLPKGKKIASANLLKDGTTLEIEKYDSDEFFIILKDKQADRPFVISLNLE